jgi:hypothetical protein
MSQKPKQKTLPLMIKAVSQISDKLEPNSRSSGASYLPKAIIVSNYHLATF